VDGAIEVSAEHPYWHKLMREQGTITLVDIE